ncbi:MAG: hypothetical protein VX370_02345 [Bacteroidota bacterium]|nr:hypothetical protein [Bacteroidota bacterium]
MKHLFPLLFIISLFTACTITDPTVLRENSNASMIEKSIANMEMVDNLSSYLNKNENIIIVPIERYSETTDHWLTGMMQDNLTREFVSSGYKILERDWHMTYRLMSESEDKYKHNHFLYSDSNLAPEKYTRSSRKNKNKEKGNDGYGSGSSVAEEHYEEKKVELKTTFNSADKIISYRIVDCGLRYDYNDPEKTKKNKTKKLTTQKIARDARTVLEVRVTDAKTSTITAAVLLDGRAIDVIDKEDKVALEDFDYAWYLHSYPNYWYTEEQTTGKKSKVGRTVGWVVGGLLGLIVTLSSL